MILKTQRRAVWRSWGVSVGKRQGAVDWTLVAEHGASFGTCDTSDDKVFQRHYKAIQDAGILRGALHFATPTLRDHSTESAREDADRYLELVGADRRLTLPPILDLGWSRGTRKLEPAEIIDWALTWLGRTEQITGQVPIVSMAYSYWKWKLGRTTAFRRYHLWMVQNSKQREMGVDVPKHAIQAHPWAFWRFSSRANVAGVSTRYCSVSAFSGRRGELSALSLSRAGFGGVFPLREYSFDVPSAPSRFVCWARELLP